MKRKRHNPEQIIRKLLAEQHRIEYNVYRPHSALQGRTPLEVLQQWKAA